MPLQGLLDDIGIVELLQLPYAGRKTGELLIEGQQGVARLYYVRGNVVHAERGELTGRAALMDLFDWKKAKFQFRSGTKSDETTIELALHKLLIELLHRFDERKGAQRAVESSDRQKKPAAGAQTSAGARVAHLRAVSDGFDAEPSVPGSIRANGAPVRPAESDPPGRAESTAGHQEVGRRHPKALEDRPGWKDWPDDMQTAQTNGRDGLNGKGSQPMKIDKLKEMFEEFRGNTGNGLVASDIWSRSTAQSIIGFNTQPAATALFNRMSAYLDKSLADSGFPSVNRYYLLDLADAKAAVVVYLAKDYLWGMLCDTGNIQIGLLLNVIIPQAMNKFKQAIET